MGRELQKVVVVLVLGMALVALRVSPASAQPYATPYLYQSGGWMSSQSAKSDTSHYLAVPRVVTTNGTSSMWTCEVWARSSAEWVTAEAAATLKVDNQVVSMRMWYPEYWGSSQSTSGQIESGLNDRTVTCEAYVADFYGSYGASQTATVAARVPADLRVDSEIWTYRSLGDYLYTRTYQVMDNYNTEWNYRMPVWESYSYGNNGCNLTIHTETASTNDEGRFIDKYGHETAGAPIPACELYPTCQSDTTQTIYVAGYSFSHGVIWRCDDVIVQR